MTEPNAGLTMNLREVLRVNAAGSWLRSKYLKGQQRS